jgi:hypothetical protein
MLNQPYLASNIRRILEEPDAMIGNGTCTGSGCCGPI